MKFYKRQHEFYCGIDLHANSMHVCVVDQGGKKHLHKNFDTKTPETLLLALAPFRKRDLIIGSGHDDALRNSRHPTFPDVR